MVTTIKLHPDQLLLNPDFDGYKLSSGSGQVMNYNKSVVDGLCTTTSNNDSSSINSSSSSYLHIRLEALNNCLTLDFPASKNATASQDANSEEECCTDAVTSAYCFNKRGQLLQYSFSSLSEERLEEGYVVWQAEVSGDVTPPTLLLPPLPPPRGAPTSQAASTPGLDEGEEVPGMFGALHPSLVFASSSLAVVADGRSGLCVLSTGARQQAHTWLTVFSATVGACKVVDARLVTNHNDTNNTTDTTNCGTSNLSDANNREDVDQLHVVVVSAVPPALLPLPPPPHLRTAPSILLVTWLTLVHDHDSAWKVSSERVYAGKAVLHYSHLNVDCSALVLLTHQHYTRLGVKEEEEEEKQEKEVPLCTFHQTEESLTIKVRLDSSTTTSSDVIVAVTEQTLSVGLRSKQEPVLRGTFHHNVKQDTVVWTVVDGHVEVVVSKREEGRWERLLKEAVEGEVELDVKETMTPAEVARKAESMAHLTSDSWDVDQMDDKPAYKPGELESCDDVDSDLLLLLLEAAEEEEARGSGAGGRSSTGGGRNRGGIGQNVPRGYLGNTQYLATIQAGANEPPLFCLRHDVDGVVWRCAAVAAGCYVDAFIHTATFNAFGYVKASKSMAKFTAAPSDCSYIAVADLRSHVYVFCQPAGFGGVLRNRRTGRVTSQIARQLLISLPTHDEVMGLAAAPGLLFVLTGARLFAFTLNVGEGH